MMRSLPVGVETYKRTAVFDQDSLPEAFKKDHNTKKGVWAVIHVLEGELNYTIAQSNEQYVLTPNKNGIIVQQQFHRVAALGAVSFYVEFYR